MKYITIFIYLLLILFIQINQQQAAPIDLSSIEDIKNYPSLWYNTINDIEDRQQQDSIDRFYKRFVNGRLLPQRQRRFGNTKYGRSLLIE